MKNHRDGGKIGGNHTTLLDLSEIMVDLAAKREEVRTISPGYIKSGPGTQGGQRRIKFGRFLGGVLMTVRQSNSVQEIRVYTAETQATMEALARAARDRRIPIGFAKNGTGE